MIQQLPDSTTSSCSSFLIDNSFRFIEANVRKPFISHLKSEVLIGKTIDEIWPAELAASYCSLYRSIVNGERVREVGLIGKEQYHIDVVAEYPNENEKLGRCLLQKINKGVKGYGNIAEDAKFKASFDSGFALKYILNADFNVMAVNRAFFTFFEKHLPPHYMGAPVNEWMFLTASNIDHLKMAATKAVSGEEQRYLEAVKLEGKNYFFEISVTPVMDDHDTQPTLLLVEMNDVTELEKNKTALSEIRLQLDKQEGEFRKIARTISHDLRAPATNLSYLVSVLERSAHAIPDQDIMEGMKTSVNSILSSIADIATILNDRMAAMENHGSASLRMVIDESLEGFSEEIARKNARVTVDVYDHSEWNIPHGILKMALTQVVSNSLKYQKETVDPEIIITVFRQGGKRVIKVEDNGIGIDLKGQEQRLFGLFQTFHQHPEARGVGLFQVKNRLKSIGGDVLLESEVGIGTTVILNFN